MCGPKKGLGGIQIQIQTLTKGLDHAEATRNGREARQVVNKAQAMNFRCEVPRIDMHCPISQQHGNGRKRAAFWEAGSNRNRLAQAAPHIEPACHPAQKGRPRKQDTGRDPTLVAMAMIGERGRRLKALIASVERPNNSVEA